MSTERQEALKEERRRRIIRELEDAKRLLPTPYPTQVKFALTTFSEKLKASDFEQAWDALIEAGEKIRANRSFYERLAMAASTMELTERRAEALERSKRVR